MLSLNLKLTNKLLLKTTVGWVLGMTIHDLIMFLFEI